MVVGRSTRSDNNGIRLQVRNPSRSIKSDPNNRSSQRTRKEIKSCHRNIIPNHWWEGIRGEKTSWQRMYNTVIYSANRAYHLHLQRYYGSDMRCNRIDVRTLPVCGKNSSYHQLLSSRKRVLHVEKTTEGTRRLFLRVCITQYRCKH